MSQLSIVAAWEQAARIAEERERERRRREEEARMGASAWLMKYKTVGEVPAAELEAHLSGRM